MIIVRDPRWLDDTPPHPRGWTYVMHGDCVARMEEIPDAYVDLVVTSPPYDNMRHYDNNAFVWHAGVWKPCIEQIQRVLAPGGACVWIVGDCTRRGSESGTSFRQALYFLHLGMCLADTMIWEKTGSGAFGSKRAYAQNFEYMFVFSKGPHRVFNPIRDRINIKPRFQSANMCIGRDGRAQSHRRIQTSTHGKRTNIWRMAPQQRSWHPAPYPEALARDHIRSWSNPGSVVLDPFSGSGTTGAACIDTQRNYIGIEMNRDYFRQSLNRLYELRRARQGD